MFRLVKKLPVLAGLSLLVLCVPAAAVAQPAHPVRGLAGLPPLLSPNPGASNQLSGVAALSATNAWAVGSYCVSGCTGSSPVSKTLILHWNGTAWSKTTSPSPGSHSNFLSGVAATSASNAWAVGSYCSSGCGSSFPIPNKTLILHWNGTAWSRVATPSPATQNLSLGGVTATSASNAWAVGYYCPATASSCFGSDYSADPLILHWNGTAWSQVASPNPSTRYTFLAGASAWSANRAWAVGGYCSAGCSLGGSGNEHTLTLRWNGSRWSKVTSPNPGTVIGGQAENVLSGVSATSSADAWAVGYYCSGCGNLASQTMILHWNGTAWSQVASPDPSTGFNFLQGVSATSASDAWAVGDYCSSACSSTPLYKTLILHWNGSSWSRVASPNAGTQSDQLIAVNTASSTDAWAVGYYCASGCTSGPEADDTLALHWNGTAWSQK
jgi:hypothetical protein